jgi:hypothetical protein
MITGDAAVGWRGGEIRKPAAERPAKRGGGLAGRCEPARIERCLAGRCEPARIER